MSSFFIDEEKRRREKGKKQKYIQDILDSFILLEALKSVLILILFTELCK